MGAAAPPAAQAVQPAQLAKAALRRLALDRLEPTPENYAAAYRHEQGERDAPGADPASAWPAQALPLLERLAERAFDAEAAAALAAALGHGCWDEAERLLDEPDASGAQIATLIERVVRGMARGGRQWTLARRRESLQHVLDSSRGNATRLKQRLGQLINSWEADAAGSSVDADDDAPAAAEAETAAAVPAASATAPATAIVDAASAASAVFTRTTLPVDGAAAALPAGTSGPHWRRVVVSFDRSLRQALPLRDGTARELADAIGETSQRLQAEGAGTHLADELERLCSRADWVLQHRQHLMEQLGALCHELTDSLSELAEDDSWARGQCEVMRARLDEGLTARGVKSVSELLRVTRARQSELRGQRDAARLALKAMIHTMLTELGELGQHTGRFTDNVGRYAEVVAHADSLESLAGVVREMVAESRAVHGLVTQTQRRLQDEHRRAAGLTQQVEQLEGELRRLASEVSTDPLTEVANRRGLQQAFDAELARDRRGTATNSADMAAEAGLAIGLLDIDNFKRLNDELGHSAGDEALKSLALRISRTLRPSDAVARYGGEEFVVLLPQTPLAEAQQILTRLQRSLTGGLFMHEQRPVLVTFSAGVTVHRDGERLEQALERADQALYEAKRSGKNRTCTG